jgi:CrcB protein
MMGVGFCGSFTTFSTFSVDVAKWLAAGETSKAATYVMTNNVGGIVAAAAGMMIMKKVFG